MPTFTNYLVGADIQGDEIIIASQAQGDILYYDGSSWVRLAAGTSGQFLKTQGAAANPMWDDLTAAWEVIATDTLTGAAASIDFSSIASGYKRIKVEIWGEGISGAANVLVKLNNDAGANYDGYGLNVSAGAASVVNNGTGPWRWGGAQTGSGKNFSGQMTIINEVSKTKHMCSHFDNLGQTVEIFGGSWDTGTEIDQITVYPSANNLESGTRVTLYGSTL